MKLSKELRKKLSKEFRYVADRMSKERDFRKKLFLYSNLGDIVSSSIDFEYAPQLVFIELILDVSYSTILNRLETIEEDKSVELIPGFFDEICRYTSELATCLEENQDTYKTLEKISELTHKTTERGYYLYTKGIGEI